MRLTNEMLERAADAYIAEHNVLLGRCYSPWVPERDGRDRLKRKLIKVFEAIMIEPLPERFDRRAAGDRWSHR